MIRLRSLIVLASVLAGCPYVPEGHIRGERDVFLGETARFRLYCDAIFGDATRAPCGGTWTVQGVLGGDETFGTITDCGAYTAPLVVPPDPPELVADECQWGHGCADTCGATLTLELVAP